MYTATDFILGVLFPVLVAVVVLSAFALLPERRRAWAAPLAIAGAFVAGYPLIANAAPSFPPRTAADWLFWLAVPVALVAALEAVLRPPAVVRAILAAGTLAVTLFLMLRPATQSGAIQNPLLLTVILAGVLLVEWWFADRAVTDDPTPTAFFGLLCILAGASVVVMLSDSQKYASHAGAAVAGGGAVLALLLMGLGPRPALLRGAPLTLVTIVGALFVVSLESVLVNVKLHNALLVGAAMPLLWAARFVHRPRKPLLAAVVQLSLPAAPVLIALAIAGFKVYQDLHGGGGGGAEEYDPWK